MAQQTAARDQFANKFYGTVTESAANTLTFAEIQTNVSVFDKQAWILHRLEWYINPAMLQLSAADDRFTVALTNSNSITSLGLNDAAVIDEWELNCHFATAVGLADIQQPIIRDFTQLPGGGIIIVPRPLFVACKGTSLGAAGSAQVRGHFTVKELKADEYIELIDYYRIVK